MDAADLPGVMAVQSACYGPAFLEPLEVLTQRWHASPDTGWVAVSDGTVVAYLVGYRSELGCLTTLGAGFRPNPEGDTLYLHDLAVAPRAAGMGLGPRLVSRALHEAVRGGCGHSALVSVQGSQGWWQRLGYRPVTALDDRARSALSSYGEGAVYMAQALLMPWPARDVGATPSRFPTPAPPARPQPDTDPVRAGSAPGCETVPAGAAHR